LKDTIIWLHAEGFIRWGEQTPDRFLRVELTMKAFSILQRTPHSIAGHGEKRKTFGELMSDALRGKATDTIADTAKQLVMMAVLGGFAN